MSNNKVKGLLKGLRYISQIFENEKEPEMQIGMPTDVKHVAHIGWDGPSVNSPSWMNDFKSSPGVPPQALNGAQAMNQTSRDMPDLPKSEKPKSKKSSKSKESSSRSSDLNRGPDSPANNSGAPKKGRRKKTKEDGSMRIKSKCTAAGTCSSQFSDNGSDAGSISKRSNDDDLLTGDGVFT